MTTYAGTTVDGLSFGSQTFLANDFEPYIRTMPHAEYPSASACLCEAFAQVLTNIVGTNNITSILSSPLFESFFAFTSTIEPLSTPQNLIVKTFSTFSEISDQCSESRLDGGMHFSALVPSGQSLGVDISNAVFDRFTKLIDGIVPDYVTIVDDTTIPNRKCGSRDRSRKDSSNSKDRSKDSNSKHSRNRDSRSKDTAGIMAGNN